MQIWFSTGDLIPVFGVSGKTIARQCDRGRYDHKREGDRGERFIHCREVLRILEAHDGLEFASPDSALRLVRDELKLEIFTYLELEDPDS